MKSSSTNPTHQGLSNHTNRHTKFFLKNLVLIFLNCFHKTMQYSKLLHCRFQHEVISVLPYSSRAFKCTMGAPWFVRFQHDKPNKQTTFFSRYQGKDIVFRFIIECSSLRDFGPEVICLFLYEDF
jgi:hypothetical protein